MKRQRTVFAGAVLAGLVMVAIVSPERKALAAGAKAEKSPVLVDAMDAELHRAMSSLGGSDAQPKPYFLSYAVSDSDSIGISAQYGAITTSNQSRRRTADVQVRLGEPAQDNTHG
ncbi:MAG: peptidase modulator of gyrase, partial [Edaphobacter sp.]|nr:peptidase modulator of gyrase [Edaphobacter sp.]